MKSSYRQSALLSAALGMLATGFSGWIASPALAADLVCRGVMFGDTDFAAYQGETGFRRIELRFRTTGRTVTVPLDYIEQNAQDNSVFRGNNPDSPSDIVQVIAPRNVQAGGRIQAVYNGYPFTGNCSSSVPSQPPTSSPAPSQGTWSGLGTATNTVFSPNQTIDAMLSYNTNSNRFSVSFSVPPGAGAQIQYSGPIIRLSGTGSSSQSFELEGRIETFATSANGLQAESTSGTCLIEVFDARIISAYCATPLARSNNVFRGRDQF